MVLIHFESAITCNLPVFDARYSVGSLFMKHPETTPSYTASIVRTPTTLPAVRPGSDENLAEASPEVGLSVVDDVIVPYTVIEALGSVHSELFNIQESPGHLSKGTDD